ncbi:MAG: 16S rRNA (uracil(1498)-N(3))-methyltransferase [Bacilli bacterium]|nr:16S rRNA (uracil(1498)-N(3))-methyltransferase [Bacilli bacterium]
MQRYFAKSKNKDKFILNESDYHHIKNVMRMKDNDLLEVVLDNKLYECHLDNYEVILDKEIVLDVKNNKQITLILPLLQEQKMDLVLQKSTELGVNKIIPIITSRTKVKLDKDKEIKKIKRWASICKEASEQSKRIDIPVIESVKKLKELSNLDGLKLICSTTEASNNIRNSLQKHKKCDIINVVIGPEGGFEKSEEDYLVNIGFEKVTLGNRILRVETAALFLLSVIEYEFME